MAPAVDEDALHEAATLCGTQPALPGPQLPHVGATRGDLKSFPARSVGEVDYDPAAHRAVQDPGREIRECGEWCGLGHRVELVEWQIARQPIPGFVAEIGAGT